MSDAEARGKETNYRMMSRSEPHVRIQGDMGPSPTKSDMCTLATRHSQALAEGVHPCGMPYFPRRPES